MSSSSHNNTGGLGEFLLGLVAGLLTGSVLALLLSPKSGPENRQQALKLAKRLPNEVQDYWHDKSEALKEDWENPYGKTRSFLERQQYQLQNRLEQINAALVAKKQAKSKLKEEEALDAKLNGHKEGPLEPLTIAEATSDN